MLDGRLIRALQAIARSTFPNYDFLGVYRYRVIDTVATRLRLQSIKSSLGLPDILYVSVYPGVPGTSAGLTPGSTVLVQFLEGDPAQPFVSHFERIGGGFLPVSVSIDATESVKVGESADLVELGSGSEIPVGGVVGRVLRYGDTIGVPGVGNVVLLLGSVPTPVSKVKA